MSCWTLLRKLLAWVEVHAETDGREEAPGRMEASQRRADRLRARAISLNFRGEAEEDD